MAYSFPLFESIWTPSREIAVIPEVTQALRNAATVAIGVSGGGRTPLPPRLPRLNI